MAEGLLWSFVLVARIKFSAARWQVIFSNSTNNVFVIKSSKFQIVDKLVNIALQNFFKALILRYLIVLNFWNIAWNPLFSTHLKMQKEAEEFYVF